METSYNISVETDLLPKIGCVFTSTCGKLGQIHREKEDIPRIGLI